MLRETPPLDSLVGLSLGRYLVLEKIGAGGMGEVYRAHDKHLDRDVALKVLPRGTLADETERKQLRHEALALSKLNHPNIATVHDFDTQQGVDFLVMELIHGVTLSDKLAGRALPESDVIQLGSQLARGMQVAHEHGVIHGDLKPSNLRVTPEGLLKILDFGLSKLMRPTGPQVSTATLTESAAISGTLPYIAPEQLRGEKVNVRTDVYEIGAVLYEMSTGRPLFPKIEGPNLIDAILHDNPPLPSRLNPQISAGLEAIVVKALEKNVSRRYASAAELLKDLERLATPTVSAMFRWQARATAVSWRRFSSRGKLAVAFFLLVSAVAFVSWISRPSAALAFAPRDYVLISDFENDTGDPIFDRSLGTAFATTLEQSARANVYPRSRMKETLARMEKPAVDHIDESLAMEIAEREGVIAIIVPTISGLGDNYRLAARIRAVATGKNVRTEVVRVKGKAKVLDALDELSSSIRRDLGESSQEISKETKPLAQVTTQSLEALKQFSLANEKHRGGQPEEAKTYYETALRIDPHFTSAAASLGILHLDQSAIGMPHFDASEGKRLLADAAQHVSNLTDKEKYGILASYAQWVERDPEKAVQYYKSLLVLYPSYPIAYNNLAWVYRRMNRYDDAISAAKEAIQIDPHFVLPYANLSAVYLYDVGNIQGALDACQQALKFDPHNAWTLDCVGWALLGKGNYTEARPYFEQAITAAPGRTLSRYRLAHTHRLQGHYDLAVQTLEPIQQVDPADTAVWYDLGVVYDLMGKHKEAREHFEHFRRAKELEWKKDPKNADREFELGAVLLRLGDSKRGMALAKQAFTLDPSDHFGYAMMLCLNHQKDEAMAELELAVKSGYKNYVWMKIHPDLQGLYGDPRFEKLVSGQS